MRFLLLVALALLILGGFYLYTSSDSSSLPTTGNIESCPNFSFDRFIETGGSKTAHSRQEAIDQIKRLNYICEGE